MNEWYNLYTGPKKRFFPGCVIPLCAQWGIMQPRENLFAKPFLASFMCVCRYVFHFSRAISELNYNLNT